jgi:phosphoglycerate dehydrogenase-like enzyme
MRILIASSISPDAIETLRQNHDVICAFNAGEEDLKAVIKDRQALVFRSGVTISADVMKQAPDLELLIRAGSGLDNVDVGYLEQHNLELQRIPGPGAKAVAEMSFGLMLALARNIVHADGLLRKGRWAKKELTGHLLSGNTLGIVGCGNIGSVVGRLGVSWGMNVIAYDKQDLPQEFYEQLADMGIQLKSFDEVISTSDFISIHVPLMDSTRHFINADVIARMKPGVFIINLARGGVVDETALLNAMTTPGLIGGAALDVHEAEGEGKLSPLRDLPNVVLTPHIGAQAVETQREIGEEVLRIIESHEKKS